MAALADAVSLETWREICRATVERAKAGDPKARDWLARYLIGEKPMKLISLAADEQAAHSPEDAIERKRHARDQRRQLHDLLRRLGPSGE
jgi:hypothetical protein